MRISDWSSDVCSSDLEYLIGRRADTEGWVGAGSLCRLHDDRLVLMPDVADLVLFYLLGLVLPAAGVVAASQFGRASCRERVFQSVYIPVVAVALKINP